MYLKLSQEKNKGKINVMREELFQEAFRKYGTPLYVFDLDILKEQTERIRAGFGPEINLCYAMKANPFLTGYMAQWSDRIEVCSMGEFRICRKLQVPPEKLFISGVMKKRDDIREILAYCGNRCAYTVESPLHFQLFCGMERGTSGGWYSQIVSATYKWKSVRNGRRYGIRNY